MEVPSGTDVMGESPFQGRVLWKLAEEVLVQGAVRRMLAEGREQHILVTSIVLGPKVLRDEPELALEFKDVARFRKVVGPLRVQQPGRAGKHC
jgi:hypothetical protein